MCDRVALLRKAFDDTMKDPAFIQESVAAGIDLNPVAGEKIQKIVADLIATRTSRRDTFAISTFESFRVFDPVLDAAVSPEFTSAQNLLDAAREHSTPLRIELFPWL